MSNYLDSVINAQVRVTLDDVVARVEVASSVDFVAPVLRAYAQTEALKFEEPRAVTAAQIDSIIAAAETAGQAALDVITFVELAHNNEAYESALNFDGLLAAGHPRAAIRGLLAAEKRELVAEWYAADASLSETAKKVVYEFYAANPGAEKAYAALKMSTLLASADLEPLTAAWSMSFAKRSAMSKALAAIRRRDRKGRFAEEFGRLKGIFSRKDGSVFTETGKIVGAVDGKNEFQVEFPGSPDIPKGIYDVPANSTEAVEAYLPERLTKSLKKAPQVSADQKKAATPLDAVLATKSDAPEGWAPLKNEQGKVTGYTSPDGNHIVSFGKADPNAADKYADTPRFGIGEGEQLDPNAPIHTLKDNNGNVVAVAQDWATIQKANIYSNLEGDKADTKDSNALDLGEQYGLDKAGNDEYRAIGMGDDKFHVYKDQKGNWVVDRTYADGNQDTQTFEKQEDAFKHVAGEAGFDPDLDPNVETPESKPTANNDGVEYGKYTPDVVADGYQFSKEKDGRWSANDKEGDLFVVTENKGKYDLTQITGRDPSGIDQEEHDVASFDTPEDAFEYGSHLTGTTWDQSWVDEISKPEAKDTSKADLAEKYNFDETTNGFSRTSGEGGSYEVYEGKDGKGILETKYSDGNQDTQEFDSVEAALKHVSEYEGDNATTKESKPDYTPDQLADGYAFSKNSDGSYDSIGTTSDGATIQVSQAKDGEWVVTELGGNGPDNWTEKELDTFKDANSAFDFANNELSSPTSFDEEAARAADSDTPAAKADTSVGQSLVKLNTDEDGLQINDMFAVDNAIDDHRDQYFATRIDDVADNLNDQLASKDTASYGDFMTGGAQATISKNENGEWDAFIRMPEGQDQLKSFDNKDDAVKFAAEEVAIFNTNNIPSAFSETRGFSQLDTELQNLETPDQALTYAGRLDEIANALEDTRGPQEQVDALRGLADSIRKEYGNGDDSQETVFYRMMAEDAPLSSSINPSVDVDSLNLPTSSESTDEKKSVSSNQAAVDKVMAGLLAAIESGEAMPWRQPFTDDPTLAGAALPRNPVTKHVYTGVNSMVLRWVAGQKGYNDGRWMTFKHAQDLGGSVRKGEKATFILQPLALPKKDKDGKEIIGPDGKPQKFVVFKTLAVFNVAQIDGINLPDEKKNTDLVAKTPLEAQDFVISRYVKSMEALGLKVPAIHYTYVGKYGSHSSSPNWSPLMDEITLPTLEQFNSPEEIFDTLMHELAHSTGHASRLDRTDLTKDYGNPDGVARAKEELIAEISSAILGQMFGIENTLDNSAAYVQSWLQRLKSNPQEVINATKEAQKVVDYMLGMHIGDWSPVDGYGGSKGGSNNG